MITRWTETSPLVHVDHFGLVRLVRILRRILVGALRRSTGFRPSVFRLGPLASLLRIHVHWHDSFLRASGDSLPCSYRCPGSFVKAGPAPSLGDQPAVC